MDAGDQVREGKWGWGGGLLCPPHLPLPTGCLFAAPVHSAPPNRPRLRRKRQVRGPHRARAVETSGWANNPFLPSYTVAGREPRARAAPHLPLALASTQVPPQAPRSCLSWFPGWGQVDPPSGWVDRAGTDLSPTLLCLHHRGQAWRALIPPAPQVRRGHPTVHSETKYVELIVINDHQLVSS